MYSEQERTQFLNQIEAFTKDHSEFICLLQIGSGVDGFSDLYSDIDLMAGCADKAAVDTANKNLRSFFIDCGAIYLAHRKWSEDILGISVYFANGLSADLSFMPVSQIPIATNRWKMLWSRQHNLETELRKRGNQLPPNHSFINDQFHHNFFYALRKTEIAIERSNYIYANIALSEARQQLLKLQAIVEGRNIHQFKAFHTLSRDFLKALEYTYPKSRDAVEFIRAKEALLSCYVQIIEHNDLCQIEQSQFQIIHCFSE